MPAALYQGHLDDDTTMAMAMRERRNFALVLAGAAAFVLPFFTAAVGPAWITYAVHASLLVAPAVVLISARHRRLPPRAWPLLLTNLCLCLCLWTISVLFIVPSRLDAFGSARAAVKSNLIHQRLSAIHDTLARGPAAAGSPFPRDLEGLWTEYPETRAMLVPDDDSRHAVERQIATLTVVSDLVWLGTDARLTQRPPLPLLSSKGTPEERVVLMSDGGIERVDSDGASN
jgi:hypothetical protein